MDERWDREEFYISTDKALIDLEMVHDFLANRSYWAAGIPIEIVKRSIENSLVFGLFKGKEQIGFARIITDYATFAYLADVFILESFRGQGLSKWLMEVIVSNPQLQGLRFWLLATRDAHGLYKKIGFNSIGSPDRLMERRFPDIYLKERL